ncbi:MAG: hypothetical protein ABUK01_08495 [Leptospirales bacterium]
MIEQFINRLTSNPNFIGQPSSTVEIHICNFIQQNKQNLAPVLTQQLFPGSALDAATQQLTEAVALYIGANVLEQSRKVITNVIDLNVLSSSGINLTTTNEELIQMILVYYEKIIKHREARQQIDAVNTILSEHMIENYINAAFENKTYLYNEIYRIDSHHFKADAVIEYLKLVTLIVPGFGIAMPVPGSATPLCATELRKDKKRLEKYFQQIVPVLRQMLPPINEDLWNTAKSIFLDHSENPDQEPTSKFLAILLLRAKDFQQITKLDKGAETPDKSWFSVHMRNAGFLGLDKTLLEDLNRLAFEMRK